MKPIRHLYIYSMWYIYIVYYMYVRYIYIYIYVQVHMKTGEGHAGFRHPCLQFKALLSLQCVPNVYVFLMCS